MSRNTNAVPQVTKDPVERIPLGWDWTGALEAGDSIDSSNWAIETTEVSPDLEVDAGSDSIDVPNNKTAVRVINGTLGETYLLVNTITTTPGAHTHVRRIEIRIQTK